MAALYGTAPVERWSGSKLSPFGVLLRNARLQKGYSLQRVAKALKVRAQFICDIELGRRAPLSAPRVLEVSTLLGCDPQPLLEAKLQVVGQFHLPITTESQARVGAKLAARWGELNSSELEELVRIIEGKT